MSGRIDSNRTLRDQAAHWTTLVDSDALQSAEELLEFHRWLELPHNARAFQEHRFVLSMIQDLPRDKAADLVETCARRSLFPALTALFDHPLRRSVAAAAVVAITVAAAWSLTFRPVREFATQTYTTGIGEIRTVRLKDGTLAYLNTQSRLRWVGSGNERHVILDKGEVLFEVSHDATRPFRVTVGNSEIRDLATQFDVYRRASGSIVVTVLSGQVDVKELTPDGMESAWTERLLKPDEQIEYTPAALITDVRPVSAAKLVRWREGFLEIQGQSFPAFISELNRYTTKPILIADPRLQAKIGGRFSIRNIPETLEHLQYVQPVVVTDTGDSYVLSYKVDASSAAKRPNASQQDDVADRP
jgi:transmembrane sensor